MGANGQPLPNTGLVSMDIDIAPDANGKLQAVINGDVANPDPVGASNTYQRKISGPNGGVQLPAGSYRIELELRIFTSAQVTTARAGVDKATLSIALRP
jgi:hypothetical protein